MSRFATRTGTGRFLREHRHSSWIERRAMRLRFASWFAQYRCNAPIYWRGRRYE